MTLMTADLEKKFEKYPFGSQEKEGMNATVIAKFYNPCGNDVWLVTEAEKQENGNWLLFGLMNIFDFDWEWGYVLLSELEKMELPFGMTIEEELSLTEKQVKDYINKGDESL